MRERPRRLLGYGESFASFGEIVQGRRADGEDFLITLPVDLWSTCELHGEPIHGPSVVVGAEPKSRRVAERMLQVLGMTDGVRIGIDLTRNIPIGKGLSSSTADMLAVVRALQALFGVALTEARISRLFSEIEPHDGLHFPMCVAYNHRRGRLLKRLHYIPRFRIVGIDAGGAVCTQAYNRELHFSPTLVDDYQRLYRCAEAAFAARDDAAIAHCAQRATELHVARTGNALMQRLLALRRDPAVLGILTAHSGTCGGLLLPGEADDDTIARVEAGVGHLGRVFSARTLSMCR